MELLTEEIGTGQLLESLKANTKERAVQHCRPGEDFVEGMLAASCTLGLQFVLDFADLSVDLGMVFWYAVGDRDSGSRALDLAFAILPSRRFTEEHDSHAHDDRPDETNAHRESPRARAAHIFGAEVDAVCGQDAHGDEKLITADKRTTDIARSGL